MGLKNRFEMDILPKLVTIAQFTILKSLFIVVPEGMKVNISIIRKFIRKTIIPSVTITKKYEFRSVIKRDDFSIPIGSCKS